MSLDLLKSVTKDININNIINIDELNNKKIFITGITGIVGLNIALTFLNYKDEASFKIYGIHSSDLPDYLLPLASDIEFIKGDLSDESLLDQVPNFDFIIHAATYGQPGAYMVDKVGTLKLNTSTTLKLFEKLNKDGKFLFFSSSSVYIDLEKDTFSETDIGVSNTDHPRACYIESKRSGEAICNAYRELGVDAKSIRLNLGYGPGTKVNDKRVLYNFIEKALKYKKIEMLDAGELPRTYCYIADVVEMALNILFNGKDAIYNVGGLSDTSIIELARIIGQKLDVPVIVPDASLENSQTIGAPKNDKLNISKYLNEFGDKKFVSLEEGIDKTIQWQKFIYNI